MITYFLLFISLTYLFLDVSGVVGLLASFSKCKESKKQVEVYVTMGLCKQTNKKTHTKKPHPPQKKKKKLGRLEFETQVVLNSSKLFNPEKAGICNFSNVCVCHGDPQMGARIGFKARLSQRI